MGPVMRRAGRQIHAGSGSGGPVAWATAQPVPDAGRVWAALSAAHQDTGLVPFLLSGRVLGSSRRPWDENEFNDPADISVLDGLDASTVLQFGWDNFVVTDEIMRAIAKLPDQECDDVDARRAEAALAQGGSIGGTDGDTAEDDPEWPGGAPSRCGGRSRPAGPPPPVTPAAQA